MPNLTAAEISKLLRELALRLELEGGNPYRARAYSRAADNLALSPVSVDQLIAEGRLKEIPGIGDALAAVITKIYETGHHPSLAAMREHIPESVLEMLRIPGLKADRIRKLHTELGISSLPELEEAAKQFAGREPTLREVLAAHREKAICTSCHARMDPLGLALENFNAVGEWRTKSESNEMVDASGEMPNGTKFEGPIGLRQVLLTRREQFVETVTEKLLMYAIGRNLQYYDGPAVREIVRQAGRNNYTFGSLVLGVVKSVPFQMREAPGRGGIARQ